MHNWHAIETESEYRRQEWERAAAADARVAQVQSSAVRLRWPRLPHLSLAAFRHVAATRLAFALPVSTRGESATCCN